MLFVARMFNMSIMLVLLQGGGHIHDLTIGYDINGKDYVLDLRLNR